MPVSSDLRALTVRQPWAWALITGHKDIENRSWPTARRGWLLLHAGAARPDDRMLRTAAKRAGSPVPDDEPLGVILGLVNLTGMHPYQECRGKCSPWAEREAWHWEMAGPVRLAKPVAARGSLNLWRPDKALLRAVSRQLPGGLAGVVEL